MTNYDEQFNLRKRHPSGRLHLLCNAIQSVLARWTHQHTLDLSYGESAGEKIDIFPAAQPQAPVLVFIHGGYFRALDKRQYRYLARPFVRSGCTVVLVNYDLAPSVPVATIVEQNIRAFQWVFQNISQWNGDPQNITLCGHSVGAFLGAKILEFDWDPEVRQGISGAILLSGLYDLGPMRQSYLNASLHLSEEDVATLNPTFAHAEDFPPVLVAVGDDETDEFIRHSKSYSETLQAAGADAEFLLIKNKNHYTVSRLLSRPSDLTKKILNICKP